MKKFFSLVLALVMALSLTTVAWGAATALPAADANGVITLTEDVTLTFTGNAGMAVADGTVIDGAGYTLKLVGPVGSYSSYAAFYNKTANAGIVVKNLKVDATGMTAGYIFDFANATYSNVDITGGSTLIVMGAGDGIVVEDCEFTGFTGTAIDTDVSGNVVDIDTCVFTGADPATATAVILRNGDSTAVGSTFNAKLNLVADDVAENVTGNTFNSRVKLYTDDEVLTGNSFGTNGVIALDDPNLDVDASNNYWGGGAPTAAQLGGASADTYYSEPDLTGITGVASAPASAVKGAYITANMDTLSVYPGLDLDTYTYSLEHYVTGNAVAKTFDQKALWATHKVTGAKVIEEVFVVAASAESADYAFVNGAQITYLNDVVGYTGTVSVVPTIDAKDAEKCGDMFVGGDYAAYTDANAKMYVEKAGGTVYSVDGKYVELVPAAVATPVVGDLKTLTPVNYTLYIVGHTYDYDAKTVNGDKTVTAVFCEECDAQFAFVEGTLADAVKKFGAGNFYDNTVTKLGVAKLYVAKTAAGSAVVTPSTDKVTSAATFDAGIAMYVGMSVMAAAGSAVVIGKKKD